MRPGTLGKTFGGAKRRVHARSPWSTDAHQLQGLPFSHRHIASERTFRGLTSAYRRADQISLGQQPDHAHAPDSYCKTVGAQTPSLELQATYNNGRRRDQTGRKQLYSGRFLFFVV